MFQGCVPHCGSPCDTGQERERPIARSNLQPWHWGRAAQAQKFAIIDMQQAVLATSDGKKATQAINEKFAPLKAQLDPVRRRIFRPNGRLRNRATIRAMALASAQGEIESMTTSINRKKEDAQTDLQDEESKQLGSIVPKLQQIINEYAAANQIMFVLDTSANPNNLIYGDKSLNIIAPIVMGYEGDSGFRSHRQRRRHRRQFLRRQRQNTAYAMPGP